MTIKVNSIFKEVLEKNKPNKKELEQIKRDVQGFIKKLEYRFKKSKIDVEIFIGGSFAKKTVIKKGDYDVDIFLRFDKKYDDKEISDLTYKILKNFKASRIHGSRDYFRVNISQKTFFEIIPVIKIKNPKDARNITDLSYFHVKYINKKIKSEKILDDILLLKKFCYANKVYGAESYINGFSGYALELLIYYYGSFLKFIKAMTKAQGKIIIDIEKHYKNKQIIMMDLNSAKLMSPIILIDPTYKQRNVLAALSYETFQKFKKVCKNFLKKPLLQTFEIQKLNLEKIQKYSNKKGFEFILLNAKTNKQEGDIAGTKLLKFYNHLTKEIEIFFEIKNRGFEYDNKKTAQYFFAVKKKKEILIKGPRVNDKENVIKFKNKHKNTFVKKSRIYSKQKIIFNIKDFINNWKNKNKKKIKEMYITSLELNISV